MLVSQDAIQSFVMYNTATRRFTDSLIVDKSISMTNRWISELSSEGFPSPILYRLLAPLLTYLCFSVLQSRGDTPREAVFDAVWEEIASHYYDPTFGGNDWKAIGDAYRSRLHEGMPEADFKRLLSDMLQELGESHFSITSPFYNDILTKSWSGGDAGTRIAIIGERAFIHSVEAGGSAEVAGLGAGWELLEVEGESVSELYRMISSSGVFNSTIPYFLRLAIENRLYGAPDQQIRIKAKRSEFAFPKSVSLTLNAYEGPMSERIGNLASMPMASEGVVGEDGIAILHFTVWTPQVMEKIRVFIRSMNPETKGLIIDIRGNPGGIGLLATGLAGMLTEVQYRMGAMQLRSGQLNFNVYPQKGAFTGPLAVLIDGNSISTSEIFAADIQETGRGRLFGSRSAGAALPSTIKKLPNRYFLQMAIADYETQGGFRIEGKGVTPDEEVGLSPSGLRKGRDSVVDAARKWILREARIGEITVTP